MRKNLATVYETRCKKFFTKISNMVTEDHITLKAEYYKTKEFVKYEDRLEGKYVSVNEGDIWGEKWESAWFHLTGEVPVKWKDKAIAIKLDLGGESLVFSDKGEPLCGLTHNSAFNLDFDKTLYHLFDKANGGEKVDCWVEATTNGLFGIIIEMNFSPEAPPAPEVYTTKVHDIKLCVFDKEMWQFQLDLDVLINLMETLPANATRRRRILRGINLAIEAFKDNKNNLDKSRKIVKKLLDAPANTSALTATSVGHAHIDTGWLWPVKESIRKTARTFANQMDMIDKYPEYVFGASQPQHYQFMKDHYPNLYQRLKKYVKNGQWELQGGMWVEPDCNIISGESMVRQVLYGKNFFMDEFGVDIKNLWLPDVFGYSAAIPQILKKSGMDYFLTQKISWNQFNKFPHHTFVWQGIDGSEVLTHFIPTDTYNGHMTPEELIKTEERFNESDILDEYLSVFGIGDGGGGPKEEHIERGLRQKNLEGSSKVKFDHAQNFFNRIGKSKNLLEKWVGELYLELHRGTLTSQAKVKKGNRTLENMLRQVEFLYSSIDIKHYPQNELESIWKVVLINQFHDILPGSCIKEVYDVTHVEHEECITKCKDLISKFDELALQKDENGIVLFNSLSYPYNRPVNVGKDFVGYELTDTSGNTIPSQDEEEGKIILPSISADKFIKIQKGIKRKSNNVKSEELVLENDLVKYVFKENGEISFALDKETGKEILTKGNMLSLYADNPLDWDAWDIDIYYEDQLLETAKSIKHTQLTSGSVRNGIEFISSISKSKIQQKVYLSKNSKRLDFETVVDWNEQHRMLRVSFDTNTRATEASFDIQYGYVKRNTHRNTSWDLAKFEVCAHKYVDLSDNSYGVALLNDCKYGHKVLGKTIDLNLLRSPTAPDPVADQNQRHILTYSLYPHKGALIDSDVIQEAAMLNSKPVTFKNKSFNSLSLPCQIIDTDGVSLEVVKKAEKENCWIIRLVEVKGKTSTATLSFNVKSKLMETNLMEWEEHEWQKVGDSIPVTLDPFEIRTCKLKCDN